MLGRLLEHAEARPDAPALVDGGRSTSYGELAAGARAGAAWLFAQGLRAGETVALQLGAADPAREASVLYALAWLGAPILPLYPESGPQYNGLIASRYARRILDPRNVDCTAAGAAPLDERSDRPLLYEFSSGTTGEPKALLLTAAQCAAVCEIVRHYGWTGDERVVPALPWPTKAALRNLLRVHAAGGALVNEEFPETRASLARLIARLGITALRSTPWQLRRLLASPAAADGAPALRYLDTTGAPISPREIRAARETLCPNTWVVYACAEAGGLAHLPPSLPGDAAMPLIPGVEAGCVAPDGMTPLPAGMLGALRFRAPWLPAGYAHGDDSPPHLARFRNGWFHPGDLGSIGPSGIQLAGRSDDVVNWGAVKIHPREVERVLEQFPGVAEAALVGVPDPMAGELPIGFVVPRTPIDLAALTRHCRASLHPGLMPPHILTLSSMPRNAEGKILRDQLRRLYEDYKKRNP